MAWRRRTGGERYGFLREPGNGPSRGGFLRIGHVRRGRRIDDVNPLMLGIASMVNVPVDVGFHVRTSRENRPEFL